MKKSLILVITLLFSIPAFCQVTVSLPVQKYIIDHITGGDVQVNVMVPQNADPHTFSPKPQQIKLLADSKLYFSIGFPFEDSILAQIKKSNKDLQIIPTDKGIKKYFEDDSEEESEIDAHVWTSPRLMKVLAKNTYNALIGAESSGLIAEPSDLIKDKYTDNYNKFIDELSATDEKFKKLFSDSRVPKTFLIYHPALGYFANDYNLKQYDIEVEGKAPKAKELQETIKEAKEDRIKVFFVQPGQAPESSAIVSKELGVPMTTINIMQENWQGLMDNIYGAFNAAKKD